MALNNLSNRKMNPMKKPPKSIVSWVLQLALAALFLMAALPKLTGDPMAAAMIEKLGVGSWAGPVIGLSELAAALLLVVPAMIHWGALLSVGILGGAIFSHLTVLGISIGPDDGGAMFGMALVGMVFAGVVVYLRKEKFLGGSK